jgi:hypothetical protein
MGAYHLSFFFCSIQGDLIELTLSGTGIGYGLCGLKKMSCSSENIEKERLGI